MDKQCSTPLHLITVHIKTAAAHNKVLPSYCSDTKQKYLANSATDDNLTFPQYIDSNEIFCSMYMGWHLSKQKLSILHFR